VFSNGGWRSPDLLLQEASNPDDAREEVAQRDETADPDLVQTLCPAEGSEDDLVELAARDEKETRLDRAVRDLDEGASLRDEADAPGHGAKRGSQGTCQPEGIAGSVWKGEAYAEVWPKRGSFLSPLAARFRAPSPGPVEPNARTVCICRIAIIRAEVLERLQRAPFKAPERGAWRLWQSGERMLLQGPSTSL